MSRLSAAVSEINTLVPIGLAPALTFALLNSWKIHRHSRTLATAESASNMDKEDSDSSGLSDYPDSDDETLNSHGHTKEREVVQIQLDS